MSLFDNRVTECVFTDAWTLQIREMSSEKKERWKERADKAVNADQQSHLLKKDYLFGFESYFLGYTLCLQDIIILPTLHSGSVRAQCYLQ